MIFEKQYKEILSQELLRYLLSGRLPSIGEISSKIYKILGKDGKVTYQYISQPSNSQFQSVLYNNSMKRIKFDIDIFQEELLELFKDINKRISYADLFYKVNNYQLKKLKAELLSLLFTMSNTDFYFLNLYDNFIDTSKLDKDESTQDIINLSERCIQIPSSKSGTKRINSQHMLNSDSWEINIVTPQNIVSSGTVTGNVFSNIFRDNINSWIYELQTYVNGSSEIKFRFPLAGNSTADIEVFVSRIEVIPSVSNQKIKVKVSTDNVNYLPVSGYEDYMSIDSNDTTYALDFETNLVQYVEISLLKETPDDILPIQDSVGNKVKQFLFGLKSFSAFTTGRGLSARYQSVPFVIDNEEGKISKISIQTDHFIPAGTNVYYYVAIDKGLDTKFLPINPIGKPTKNGVPEVITLNSVSEYNNKFSSDISGIGTATHYGAPFQGKVFYKIGPSLLPKPVFGSVSLYRGYKHWYRDKTSKFDNVDLSDVYINFSNSNIEALYAIYTEEASFENRVSNEQRISILSTTKFPYYDQSKGHSLTPTNGVDPLKDLNPNYSIYKITQTTNSSRVTSQLVLSSETTQNLPSTNFISTNTNPTTAPILRTLSGTVYRLGIDYEFEVEIISGVAKPTGRFTIPEGSSLLNSSGQVANPSLVLEFVYTVDPDITHKVTAIQDNFITLSNCLINSSDNITIQYRYIPKSPNEIVSASIRVSNQPSSVAGRSYYVESVDYSIDPVNGLIQRIDNGNIPTSGKVYVNYRYKNSIPGINTFTTWVKIDNEEGVRINLELNPSTKKNKLIVDSKSNEALYINGPNGLIDITNSIVTPTIGPGWVQIICKSKDPDANTSFGSNLIDQVIQLKDSYRKRIFREGGSYFGSMIAFREPLIQKTLNHLKVNTLKDNHEFFAIDDFTDPSNNYIVINFSPNNTEEIYNRTPSSDEDPDERPSQSSEIFYVEWNSKNTNSNNIDNDIIIRIDLERSQSVDGGITPKVFNYQIRAST